MTSKSYSEKLRDPRWQKRRLEIFERDNFSCTACGSSDKTLHVHHLYYCKGREPWEYPNFCLNTRCEDCHKSAEADCRADDGSYVMAEWEEVFERLTNGVSHPDEFSGCGVPDVAHQLLKVVQSGMRHSQGISVILHAITDFRAEIQGEVAAR